MSTDRPLIVLYGAPVQEASREQLFTAIDNILSGAFANDMRTYRIAEGIIMEMNRRIDNLEAIEEGGIKRFDNGMSFRRRCGDCYRAGRDDAKYGKFCHRCGSREELT